MTCVHGEGTSSKETPESMEAGFWSESRACPCELDHRGEVGLISDSGMCVRHC